MQDTPVQREARLDIRQSNCSVDALLVSELSSIICETLLHLKVNIVTTDLHQQFCHHLHPHHPHHHLFCHHHHDIYCKSATSPPLVSVTATSLVPLSCPVGTVGPVGPVGKVGLVETLGTVGTLGPVGTVETVGKVALRAKRSRIMPNGTDALWNTAKVAKSLCVCLLLLISLCIVCCSLCSVLYCCVQVLCVAFLGLLLPFWASV